MILDQQLTLTTSSVTTVSADPGTSYNSTDIIDLGSQLRDIAEGDVLKMVFTVNSTFAGGSGSSIVIELMQCDNSNFTGNVAAVQYIAGLNAGSITAGTQRVAYLSPPYNQVGSEFARYMFIRVRAIGTNAFTLTNSQPNTITASFAIDKQDGKTFYASGIKFA